MMEILRYMKSETTSLRMNQKALEFANPPRLRKFPRLLDLSNNDMESECLTSEHTSRIETSTEKRFHVEKSKSSKYGSPITLNPVKENHKLSVKQASRKERSSGREKSKTPVRGTSKSPARSTSKTPVRVQKNSVRKSIPTIRNQEESEDSSDEDYRPKDDV